jgi:hypothetical protein
LGQFLDRRPAIENEVVAILHLSEEQTMLTAGLLTPLMKGVKVASHF